MKQYLIFFRNYKKAVIVSSIQVIADVVFETVQPGLMFRIVDTGVRHKDMGYISLRLLIQAPLKNPAILLLLDDSTSAVDTSTEARIRSAFRHNRKGTTIVLIAQRISSILSANKIVPLDDGATIAEGTHHELMASCTAYQDIFYSQQPKEKAIP